VRSDVAAAVAAPIAPAAKLTRTAPAVRAQTLSNAQPEAAPAREPKAAAVTKYDFENDEVEGTLVRPDMIDVFGDPVVKHASLIEIRRELVSEIAKMLEDF
jgi:hypothetical protein